MGNDTHIYHKTDKFIRYQKIEALKHYLTVEPDKTLVECYTKQADGSWEVETFTDISETILLSALNIQLALHDIYERNYSLMVQIAIGLLRRANSFAKKSQSGHY